MFLPHEDQREPRHLDLGCGIKPRNPYKCPSLYGIDLRPLQVPGVKEIRQADLLTGQIPYDSDFFDSVSAYDFLEHVPRVALTGSSTRFPFVDLMNEIWRVLRHRGLFYASTPAYPHPAAFQDPTHVNILTRQSHVYFTRPELLARMYGFHGEFECLRVVSTQGGKFEYEPPLQSYGFLERFRRRRRERRGKNSHLVWEFMAVKASAAA